MRIKSGLVVETPYGMVCDDFNPKQAVAFVFFACSFFTLRFGEDLA